MLGAYPIALEPHTTTPRNPDLERYLRLEYRGNMTVAALLARAPVSRKSRTKGRKGFAAVVHALAKAFRGIAAGRRSKNPSPEA